MMNKQSGSRAMMSMDYQYGRGAIRKGAYVLPGLMLLLLQSTSSPLAAEELSLCPDVNSTMVSQSEPYCLMDSELAEKRGGFTGSDDIVIGFGFERLVRIDGEVQEHILAALPAIELANNVRLVPVSRISTTDVTGLQNSGSSLSFMMHEGRLTSVQGVSGAENALSLVQSTQDLQQLMNNAIQNDLDGVTIEQMRTINIELLGVGKIQSENLQNILTPLLIENLGF